MPTYDYQCSTCSGVFELFHGIHEQPETACPQCGSPDIRRRISGGAGIIFKGSGFYVTDNAKATGRRSSAGEKESEAVAEGGKSSAGAGSIESGSGDTGKGAKSASGAAAVSASS